MSKIPTAEEFLQDHLEISHFYDDKTNQMVCFSSDVQKAMIEFAKLRVQQALKQATNTVEIHSDPGSYYHREFEEGIRNKSIWVPSNSILNAYPLTNIK